jgi:TRAP transporter 4TM/12TM fusion protein
MKKIGYEKNYAGAVEAVASTGGQIMPPIMGAGAFIMAEYIGIPYTAIAKHALFPALLYFTAVFLQVYFEARRLNLPNIAKEDVPKLKTVIIKQGYLALPLVAIILFMMIGFSPMRSGFYGVITVWVISLVQKDSRMGAMKIATAMRSAAMSIVPVASACACAGIVIAVVRLTGLGLKFSSAVLGLASGSLILAMIFTMFAALILGMGLPTTASYVIQAALAAPALIQLGLEPVQAHLFIFYFSCISCMTPPVALASYAAAPICGGNPFIIGIKAFKLGLAAFIVPYMFAAGPAILLIGSPLDLLIAIPTAVLGIIALSISLTGWLWGRMNILIRFLFMISALGLMIQGVVTDLSGLGIFLVAILLQRSISRGRPDLL